LSGLLGRRKAVRFESQMNLCAWCLDVEGVVVDLSVRDVAHVSATGQSSPIKKA
jgi:regulator of RNase E activity RraA